MCAPSVMNLRDSPEADPGHHLVPKGKTAAAGLPRRCPVRNIIPAWDFPEITVNRQQGPLCLRVSSGLASTGLAPSAPRGIAFTPHEVSSLLLWVFNCGLHCTSKLVGSQGKTLLLSDKLLLASPGLMPSQCISHPSTHQPVLEILALIDLDRPNDAIDHRANRQDCQNEAHHYREWDQDDTDQDR
jgi:hypothetical protein